MAALSGLLVPIVCLRNCNFVKQMFQVFLTDVEHSFGAFFEPPTQAFITEDVGNRHCWNTVIQTVAGCPATVI